MLFEKDLSWVSQFWWVPRTQNKEIANYLIERNILNKIKVIVKRITAEPRKQSHIK